MAVPVTLELPLNRSVPADANAKDYQPKPVNPSVGASPALSMANQPADGIRTRKIAILAADGVDESAVTVTQKALAAAGAQSRIVAPRGGMLASAGGAPIKVDHSLLTTSSVMFDAVYIPGGPNSIAALGNEADALHFIHEAYNHCKTIAATGEGCELVSASSGNADMDGDKPAAGILLGRDAAIDAVAADFIAAVAQHRHWSREMKAHVPV